MTREVLVRQYNALRAGLRPFEAQRLLHDATAESSKPMVAHLARRVLRDQAPELAVQVGRAWFPVTSAPSVEGVGGLVRIDVLDQVSVARPANQQDRFAAALAAGAAAAGDEERGLQVVLWPADVTLEGRSFELAVALAAWSRITGEALPGRLACSGQVEGERVVAPGQLLHKRQVVDAAWGPEGRLVSGPTAAMGVEHAAHLSEIIGDCLGLGRRRVPLGHLGEAARKAYKNSAWSRTIEQAASALAQGDGVLPEDELFGLAALQAHARAHLGLHAEAEVGLRQAFLRWGPQVPAPMRAQAWAVLGVALLDGDQVEAAVDLLEGALVEGPPLADAASRYGRAQLHGTLARALSAAGRHEAAITHGQLALALTRPYEKARNFGDLAHWHLRAGDGAAATLLLDQAGAALPVLEAVDSQTAALTTCFLQLFRARAHLLEGAFQSARTLALGLITHRDYAIVLGAAEVLARLGEHHRPALRVLDAAVAAPGTLLARLRARVELAGPHPDLAQVAIWLGVPVSDPAVLLTRLEAIPY